MMLALAMPPALAHRLRPVTSTTLFESVDERRHDAGTAGAQRVADRDGPAIDVRLGQVGTRVDSPRRHDGSF